MEAGVLEQDTVDLLNAMGVGAGLQRVGLRHEALYVKAFLDSGTASIWPT